MEASMDISPNSERPQDGEILAHGLSDAADAVTDSAATEPDSEAVAHELKTILNSPHFRTSKRSQQFLSYVVQYRLDGNHEPLKERTIGMEIFNRPAGYATGDDSVVRVQAGEVRRRLSLYYQAPPADSRVLIDLPLGSYAPEFHWYPAQIEPPTATEHPAALVSLTHELEAEHPAAEDPSPLHPLKRRTLRYGLIAVLLLLLAAVAGFWALRGRASHSILAEFWAPLFANGRPVLICLPKPICYRPSITLFNRHATTPGEFDSEVDRMNQRPHLKPEETLRWDEMWEYGDLGVGKGDVKAAIRLSSFLGRIHKDSEVRIGNEYAFEDLRTSPAIIVGAFSNRWTMQMTSGLHFTFAEDRGVFRIQEQGQGNRAWYAKIDRNGTMVEDYGVVTRMANSSTGQFVVFVAGITASGSEAAADMATSPEGLVKALDNAPSDWKSKNVQIVVKATVTDSIPGPAQVVATYIW